VERVLASVEKAMDRRYALLSRGVDWGFIASRVSELMCIDLEEAWAQGKSRRIVEARSVLCYWAVRELGMSLSSLARKLSLSIPSVSDSVARGRRIAEVRGWLLIRN
jgi:putative transposase